MRFPNVEMRVKDLLSRMTLEEKIGQLVQIEKTVATPQGMRDIYIGSVISGGESAPLRKASVADWVNMVNELHNSSLSMRLGIPMIYGIDVVHGHNIVVNATIILVLVPLGHVHRSCEREQGAHSSNTERSQLCKSSYGHASLNLPD